MKCKHTWPIAFVRKTFQRKFLNGEYVTKRVGKVMEREKSMFPATIPLVEEEYRRFDIRYENNNLQSERDMLMERVREIDNTIYHNRRRYGNANADVGSGGEKYVAQYLMSCPEEGCRGYIEAISWMCGICKVKMCKECHGVKNDKEEHECDPNAVKTAKTIMKETKACPKCATRIFKINGCDVMFCTKCNTGFDWKTGEIQTGNIHNPHYFEYLRSHGKDARTPGDVVCGGIPRMDYLMIATEGFDNDDEYPAEYQIVEEEFDEIYRRLCEVNTAMHNWASLAVEDLARIRVRYLMELIPTEEEFAKEVMDAEKRNLKKTETRNILDTFVVTITERFNYVAAECEELVDAKIKSYTPAKPKAKAKAKAKGKGRSRAKAKVAAVRVFPTPTPESPDSPLSQRKLRQRAIEETVEERYAIVKPVMAEMKEVIKFCNTSIIETYKALGCYTGPLIFLCIRNTGRSAHFRSSVRFSEYIGKEDEFLNYTGTGASSRAKKGNVPGGLHYPGRVRDYDDYSSDYTSDEDE